MATLERELTYTFQNVAPSAITDCFNDITLSKIAVWQAMSGTMRIRINCVTREELCELKTTKNRQAWFGSLCVYKVSEEERRAWPLKKPKLLNMFMRRWGATITLNNGNSAVLEISQRYPFKTPVKYHPKFEYREQTLDQLARPPFWTAAIEIQNDSDLGAAHQFLFERLETVWSLTLFGQYFQKCPRAKHLWPHEWNVKILPIARETQKNCTPNSLAFIKGPVVVFRHKYDGVGGAVLEFDNIYVMIFSGQRIVLYKRDDPGSELSWTKFFGMENATNNLRASAFFEATGQDRHVHYFINHGNTTLLLNFRSHQLSLESWVADAPAEFKLSPKPYWFPGQTPPSYVGETDGIILETWHTNPPCLIYKIKPGNACTVDGQMLAGGYFFKNPKPSPFMEAKPGLLHSLVRCSGCRGGKEPNPDMASGIICELKFSNTMALIPHRTRSDKTWPNPLFIAASIGLLSLIGDEFMASVLRFEPLGYFKASNTASLLRKFIRSELLAIIKKIVDPDLTILEFGCGRGSMIMPFLSSCKAYIGVDNDAGALIELLNRIPKTNDSRDKKTRLGLWCGSFNDAVSMHDLAQTIVPQSVNWIWFPHSLHYADGNFEPIRVAVDHTLRPDGRILIIAYDYQMIVQELQGADVVGTEESYIKFRKSKKGAPLEILSGFTGTGDEDWAKEPIFDPAAFQNAFKTYECIQSANLPVTPNDGTDEAWIHRHMKYYIFRRCVT